MVAQEHIGRGARLDSDVAAVIELLAAGWVECDYWGQPRWRSPDGRTVCALEQALRQLDVKRVEITDDDGPAD